MRECSEGANCVKRVHLFHFELVEGARHHSSNRKRNRNELTDYDWPTNLWDF